MKTVAPIIDRVLSESKDPLTYAEILAAHNALAAKPSTLKSIANTISRSRAEFGWVQHGKSHPARYRKGSQSGSEDPAITEKPVRAVSHSSPSNEVEKRANPSERYDAAKKNRDNLSASAMLETMTNLLAAVRTLRGSLAEIGVTFEDRFFVASFCAETGRHEATAGRPVPKDG